MIYPCEQYSSQWWEIRNGKATASMTWAIIKKLKRAKKGEEPPYSVERQNYRDRIVSQILCGYQGQKEDEWKGWDAEWGMEFEAIAHAEYELRNGCELNKVGFITHDAIPRFGCSPDALCGTDGIVQIKCPKTTTHLNYLLDGIVPEEYEPQLVAELSCTGRQWADFVSYDPRPQDKKLQMFTKRMPRNEERIKQIETEVISFLDEVDATIAKLYGQAPTLEEQLRASLAAVEA